MPRGTRMLQVAPADAEISRLLLWPHRPGDLPGWAGERTKRRGRTKKEMRTTTLLPPPHPLPPPPQGREKAASRLPIRDSWQPSSRLPKSPPPAPPTQPLPLPHRPDSYQAPPPTPLPLRHTAPSPRPPPPPTAPPIPLLQPRPSFPCFPSPRRPYSKTPPPPC